MLRTTVLFVVLDPQLTARTHWFKLDRFPSKLNILVNYCFPKSPVKPTTACKDTERL